MRYLLIYFFLVWSASMTAQADNISHAVTSLDSLKQKTIEQKKINKELALKQTITHFVMKNEDSTYGYAIFIDGNMMYHQPNIPAISGNKGFEKVEHADAVALLAITKLKEGESPPTVSVEEVEILMKKGK